MKPTIPQWWWLSVLQLEVFQTSVLYLPAIIQYLFILIVSLLLKNKARNIASSLAGSAAGCSVFANRWIGNVLSFHLSAISHPSARRVTNRGFSVFLWRGRHVVINGNACNGNRTCGLDGDQRKHVRLSLFSRGRLFCFQRPLLFVRLNRLAKWHFVNFSFRIFSRFDNHIQLQQAAIRDVDETGTYD